MPKGADAITVFLGAMKARAAYVPADFMAPAERNRAILSDCQVRVAFLASSCADVLSSWPEQVPLPASVVFFGDSLSRPVNQVDAWLWSDAVRHEPARVEGRTVKDVAYILYTSGSTGIPK